MHKQRQRVANVRSASVCIRIPSSAACKKTRKKGDNVQSEDRGEVDCAEMSSKPVKEIERTHIKEVGVYVGFHAVLSDHPTARALAMGE